MTAEELYAHIFGSQFFQAWHWFRWHFEHKLGGGNHPFAEAIVNACLQCERAIPGFAVGMVNELAAISGRERFEDHYEQLLQRLCELHIIHQVVSFPWPFDVQFTWEPTAAGSVRNPEITINGGGFCLGVEVKAPSLFKHIRNRRAGTTQIVARAMDREQIEQLAGENERLIYPVDNRIKDFLVSADQKFRAFKAEDSNFRGVLVIIWDDFIHEPLSALLHENCGLLTPNSFYKDDEGKPVVFRNIDAVIVIRHLHQLIRATRDEPLVDACRHPFDYGLPDDFPPKFLVLNPHGDDVPDIYIQCFQAQLPRPEMGAEATPKDLIWWI